MQMRVFLTQQESDVSGQCELVQPERHERQTQEEKLRLRTFAHAHPHARPPTLLLRVRVHVRVAVLPPQMPHPSALTTIEQLLLRAEPLQRQLAAFHDAFANTCEAPTDMAHLIAPTSARSAPSCEIVRSCWIWDDLQARKYEI
eukprot:5613252-Pleurochrysis_carterae.AAC.1